MDTIQIKALQNTFIKKELKLLVLDRKGVYNIPHFKPSYLLKPNDPGMNLDSILLHIHPKMVTADGSNPTWSVSRWKKTCQKHKIPFVNLREKGGSPINP
jgi:competence protein ComEC